MSTPPPPIKRGVKRGIKRLEEADLHLRFEPVHSHVASVVHDYIEETGRHHPNRFWNLMSELITIGIGARIADKEEPMTTGDVIKYIDHSQEFFNTWNHPQ